MLEHHPTLVVASDFSPPNRRRESRQIRAPMNPDGFEIREEPQPSASPQASPAPYEWRLHDGYPGSLDASKSGPPLRPTGTISEGWAFESLWRQALDPMNHMNPSVDRPRALA